MGLGSALAAAASGLRITQDAVTLAARNISNADNPGYTRKSLLQDAVIAGDQTIGVMLEGYTRDVSMLIQRELRGELTGFGFAQSMNTFYDRIDKMFGAPGNANALDTLYNSLTESLAELATTPESISVQTQVVTDAQVLAQRLNGISNDIQNMRQEAEQQIGDIVERVNVLLKDLEANNERIVAQTRAGRPPVDLLDQRDRTLDELSQYMDLTIIDRPDGGVSVLTGNGTMLFDQNAARLTFDERATLNAGTLYHPDDAQRGVGTVSIFSPAGYEVDLIKDNAIGGGALGALIQLRDDVLVEAQRQLDEFAAALSRSFSDNPVAGTAATAGAQAGFDIDVGALQAGDPITLTYVDNVSGDTEVVTFIRTDTASVLPLGDDATARTDDTVYGIDFSGGNAAVAAQIGAALGANFTVSDQGGTTIRILDDGAANQVNVVALDAVATATAATDQGLGFPLFIDGGYSPEIYSGTLDDGVGQLVGFSGRIGVNADIVADPNFLVTYSTSPPTAPGDATRPEAMLDRLTATDIAFSPATGLGGSNAYKTSVEGFLRQMITFQGSAAANAGEAFLAQDQIVTTLTETYARETGVNVDEEMAHLIELQNAYAANARVISVIDEMIDTLMRI